MKFDIWCGINKSPRRKPHKWHCWWFRNPAVTSWGWYRVSVYPIISRVLYISGGHRRISEPSTVGVSCHALISSVEPVKTGGKRTVGAWKWKFCLEKRRWTEHGKPIYFWGIWWYMLGSCGCVYILVWKIIINVNIVTQDLWPVWRIHGAGLWSWQSLWLRLHGFVRWYCNRYAWIR